MYEVLRTGVYCPNKFSALSLKTENPHVTIILFSTGNVTAMGCTSYFGMLYALHQVKRKLKLRFLSVKLTNIVANINLNEIFGRAVDLPKFFKFTEDCSTLNMGVFPCCSYKLPGKKTKANVFQSGQVNVMGSRGFADMEENISSFLTVVEKFIAQDEVGA